MSVPGSSASSIENSFVRSLGSLRAGHRGADGGLDGVATEVFGKDLSIGADEPDGGDAADGKCLRNGVFEAAGEKSLRLGHGVLFGVGGGVSGGGAVEAEGNPTDS
jgi:hypothetical protein